MLPLALKGEGAPLPWCLPLELQTHAQSMASIDGAHPSSKGGWGGRWEAHCGSPRFLRRCDGLNCVPTYVYAAPLLPGPDNVTRVEQGA